MAGEEENTEDPIRVGYPNDAFFKDVFSQPEYAVAFFQDHLPAALAAKVDWPSLNVLPSSFVKSSLQQIHSDLLFSVKISGQESLLYLLFEHQSSVDPAMSLRLLGYMTEILTRHHETHGFPLPAVLPFVLHQGPKPWQVSTAFEDLFDLPEEAAGDLLPFLPKFRHALLDLTQFDPTTEIGNAIIRNVLNLMREVRKRKVERFFGSFASTIAEEFPDTLLAKMLHYALFSDSNLDVEEIYHTLSTNPELQKKVMSVAEKLLAQGELKGRQEGELKGELKGEWYGKIQTLEEFLEKEITSKSVLKELTLEQLVERYQSLHQAYEVRFKRN